VVTGGSGQIGSAIIRAVGGLSCRIFSVSRRRPEGNRPAASLAQVTEIQGDLHDPDLWSRLLKDADFIFHLAAQTNAYQANADPSADFKVNALPVLRLVEYCRAQDRSPTVLFAGTSTQIGLPTRLPVDETAAECPNTIYDIHKLLAEKYLLMAAFDDTLQAAVLRLTNVYGPGPPARGVGRGILNRMVQRALQGEPLTVYGDGALLRDYIFIDDVARAFLLAGVAMNQVNGRFFVLGTGRGQSILDAVNLVAERTARKTGRRATVTHLPPPEGLLAIEQRNFVADTTRFRDATGWKPEVSLEEGIDRTIDHYWDREHVGQL
jgi:nucleoside-diphosphate-sugar epimerase